MKHINYIKKYRIDMNFTQKILSQKAKLTLRALQSYERGERLPDIYTAQRIADILNATVEELFKED